MNATSAVRFAVAALTFAITMFGAEESASPTPEPPAVTDRLPVTRLWEASGLAASRRAPGLYWSHNDSGNEPMLHAMAADGTPRGTLRITDVEQNDWEDLASIKLDGRAWLLIADVGDNDAKRQHGAELLLVPEPDPATLSLTRSLFATPAVRLPVRYSDGPRDVEAVAVDAPGRRILLISKRETPARVYELPLVLDQAAAARVPVARRVGQLQLPQPTGFLRLLPAPTGRFRSWPTALDINADASLALVLTYGDVWLFPRAKDQRWADAFATNGIRLAPHGLVQAEAAAFSADGQHVLVTTEGAPADILRYRIARPE